MTKKLWGGRFGKKTDLLVEEFTKSIGYDYKLAQYDVLGTMIHAAVLNKSGFITDEEMIKLDKALGKLYDQIEKASFKFDENAEDIHTNMQNALEKEVGDLVLKLHTARSRNDQVLFDLKFFCLFEIREIRNLCLNLQKSLLESCKKNFALIIPGYTHLQHAQLVSLSDYLGAYDEMLERDQNRLENVRNGIKLNLGSGAFAGTPIQSELYNEAIKKFLEEQKDFTKVFNIKESITIPRSIDTVSDRDFVIEVMSALAILGMHLSRLAEDLIIWSTKEFGFVELDDAFATGSSLMPQKKNPDVLELIRGYTGMLYGNLVSVLTMMKGLPLSYNRDMQLDKPPLFSSFEIVSKELKVLSPLIKTLKWNEAAINKTIKGEEADETLYATDFVYHLINEKGIPFKTAHDIIGKLVRESAETGRKIKEMTDKELKRISDKLNKKELLELMDPIKSVMSRKSVKRDQSLDELARKAKFGERREA